MTTEKEPKPVEDITLRFVIDGVYFALTQNIYDDDSREELKDQLIKWIPEAEIVEIPDDA